MYLGGGCTNKKTLTKYLFLFLKTYWYLITNIINKITNHSLNVNYSLWTPWAREHNTWLPAGGTM